MDARKTKALYKLVQYWEVPPINIDKAKLAIGEILCELEGDKSEQAHAENYAIAEGFLEDFLEERGGVDAETNASI